MVSPISVRTLDGQATAASWYQAATLEERLALLPMDAQAFSSLTQEQRARGQRRFKQWKNQATFQDQAIFSERLMMDHLTERDFQYLLAESSERVQQRIVEATGVPTWLQELLAALEKETECLFPATGSASFIDLFQLLIEPERERVLTELRWYKGAVPFDPETVLELFQTSLAQRLHSISLRAVVLEMHIARLEERLEGQTPEERFANFFGQLSQREHLSAFLQEYPVLARILVTTIHQWASFSLEIVRHLSEDWEAIRTQLLGGADPGLLSEIQGGVGDTHHSGKSVTILRFASGARVVYKPRSLALDQHFQELLAWINAQQATLPLRTLALVDRADHGWIEFVEVHACRSEAEVERFYERQGSYLALLYALDAVDFHYENILAAGEHPVMIDLEALFHPRFSEDEEQIANQAMNGSVLRTTFLPQRAYLGDEGEGLDLSGLGGGKPQVTPYPVQGWEGNGTDQMRAVYERRALPEGHNRPKLHDQDRDVLAYESFFLQGFTKMYRLLVARRAELLASVLPRFAHDDVRVILRATRIYATLLTESFHPEYLRNALERERVFDHLWDNISTHTYLRPAIAAERRDFLQGDIPLFTTQPVSRDIFSSQGERLTDVCAQSSMDYVSRRLQQMDENDLERQCWIIQGSFATLITESENNARLQLAEAGSARRVTADQLIQGACAVGERLKHLAVRQKQGMNWSGIELVKEVEEKTFWSVQTMGPLKLYDGTPGVTLFLAYLGELTGECQYTNLARSALTSIAEFLEKLFHPDGSIRPEDLSTCPIGAYEGLGSLIYLSSHLHVLWRDPALLSWAEGLMALLDHCIEQDGRLDLMGGAAGGIVSLQSLQQTALWPQALQVALHCGEHLLTQLPAKLAENALQPGFAYGLAGIAFSLLKLADVAQDERFRQAALDLLARERSLFVKEQRNWPRLAGQERGDFPVAWCHGAPGIALARLGTLALLDDPTTREEIALALQTTREQGFGLNHSLCHGDLGNLEVLLTARQISGSAAESPDLAERTALVFASIERQGWYTGVPLGRETPGLMTGLAGIGYELLRLAKPDQVPSVLLLAPPCPPLRI